MKLAIPVLVLALGSACAPQELSVQVLGAAFLDKDCKVADEDLVRLAGSVNMGLTGSYFAAFRVESHLQQIETSVGDDVLAGPERNDFVATRIRFRYSSSAGTTFADQAPRPVHFVIPAASQDSWVGFNLLTPEIAQELATQVLPGSQPIDLLVNFTFEGHLYSQPAPRLTDPAPMRTNEVTFPIRVGNFPPSCTLGTPIPVTEAPCGNAGQDGLGFTCT